MDSLQLQYHRCRILDLENLAVSSKADMAMVKPVLGAAGAGADRVGKVLIF